MDGWVIIETRLDSKQLEKDLREAEKKLARFQRDEEKLLNKKAQLEVDLRPYENQRKELDKLLQQYTSINEKIKNANRGTEEGHLEYLKYTRQLGKISNIIGAQQHEIQLTERQYQKVDAELKNVELDLEKNRLSQSLLNNEIDETRKRINKINFKDLAKSIGTNIKQIAKLTIGIFGVATAYGAIRSAMSTLTQYNQELLNKIDTIRLSIATALEPVVNGIVDLVYKILTYIDYIARAWFNISIFAKASEKHARNMRKALAGFDEMNILDNSSSTTSQFVMPKDEEIPWWVDWIAKNKEATIGAIGGIASAFALIKFAEIVTGSKTLWDVLKGLFTFIGENAAVIGGVLAIVGGIGIAIKGVIDYLKDPSWENFIQILLGIAIAAGGVMLIFGGVPALITLIIGLIAALVLAIVKNWNEVKEFTVQMLKTIGEIIANFFKGVGDVAIALVDTLGTVFQGFFEALVGIIKAPFIIGYETVVGVFNGIKTTVKGVFDVISGLFTGDWKRVMNGFKDIFKGTFNSLWSIAKAPLNLIIEGINALIRGANKISFDVPDWVPGIGGQKWGFKIPTIPKLKVGGIVNMPGRGVLSPYGNALRGESGAEGVIPLTDSQAMETLGQAIGKYINISATVPVYVGNRQIAREIKKINAKNDFAFNK